MIPLNKQMNQDIIEINNFISNYQHGKTKEYIAGSNQYLRLFTFEMGSEWKTSYVLFHYGDTQGDAANGICNINFRKNIAAEQISVTSFNTLNFHGNLANKLYAVITGTNKVEVYVKAQSNESPTLNIINISKHNSSDYYGKLTIDCVTVVSSLPSGTQKTPTNLL